MDIFHSDVAAPSGVRGVAGQRGVVRTIPSKERLKWGEPSKGARFTRLLHHLTRLMQNGGDVSHWLATGPVRRHPWPCPRIAYLVISQKSCTDDPGDIPWPRWHCFFLPAGRVRPLVLYWCGRENRNMSAATVSQAELLKHSGRLFARPTFLSGMASLMDLGSTLWIYHEAATPHQADSCSLASDWAAVADDLRAAIVSLNHSLLKQ